MPNQRRSRKSILFQISPLLLIGSFIFAVLIASTSAVLATARDAPPSHLPAFWRRGEDGGLFVMDLSRRMLERVAHPPPLLIVDVPLLSGDGHRVVFEGMEAGRLRVYARDAAQALYITNPAIEDRLPGWSLDGTKLAFWSNRVFPASGSRWQNWNFFIFDVEQALTRQMTNELGCIPYNNPSWSPNGRWITAQFWCSGGENGTFILDIETSTFSSLRPFIDAGGDLVWSPNGEYLAFRSDRDRNGEVYVLELETGEVSNLTRNPATDFQPSWSPDGRQLAFVSTRDEIGEIYVMDANGGDPHRLTYGGGWLPAWSPDGEWISFMSDRSGIPALYLVPSNGGDSLYVDEISQSQLFLGWYQQDI